MSIGAIGGVRDQISTTGLVGAGTGVALGAGLAIAGSKSSLVLPWPVSLTLGAAIAGPITAVSLMNNTGEPNKAWQSLAVGAAPLAVIGGALGALGTTFNSSGAKAMIGGGALGAVTFGAVGAGIGALAHWATKPD